MAGPLAAEIADRETRRDGVREKVAEAKLAWIRRTDIRARWLERSLAKEAGPPLERWWRELREKTKKAVGDGLPTPPPLPFPPSVQPAILAMMRQAYAHGWNNGYRLLQTLYRTVARKRIPALKVRLSDVPPHEPPGWESNAAIQETGSAVGAFASGAPAAEWRDVIPEEALKFLKGYTPELAGVLERDCLDRVSRAIDESMKAGLTVPERVMRVSGALDDLEKFPAHRLAAIARTESLRAYNLGSLSTMARLHSRGRFVEGVEFSAILDGRTSDACKSRHGLRMRLDDPRLEDNTPPLHPNCRSVLVPIVWGEVEDGWSSDAGWQGAEPGVMRESDRKAVRDVLRAARSM